MEALAVLTGIISHVGVTNKYMKCANNNKNKPQQVQKMKRNHDSSSHQNSKSANHLTTSIMVVKHVDWIKQVAMKGSCKPVEDGPYNLQLISLSITDVKSFSRLE